MARKLLFLNGLAIIYVVLYHASAWGFISMFWWAHRYRSVGEINFDQLGNIEYYGLRMIEQLVIFAIPAFVFVSGYFIAVAAGREGKPLGWDFVFSRIKFLVIPFVLWSIVSLLFRMFLGERFSPFNFLILMITGRAVDPFYFIPMLVQLYLFSPALVNLVRMGWKSMLVVSTVIQILVLLFRYTNVLWPGLSLFSTLAEPILFTSYIFWFVLGITIGLNLVQHKNTLNKYKYWYLWGMLLFFVAGMVEWEVLFRLSGQEWIGLQETLIDQIYALLLILAFLAFDKIRLPWRERITNVGSRSYAIYLVHSLILISTSRLVYHIAPLIMEYQILFQSILAVMGLGIPLCLTYILERSFVRAYYRHILG